MRGRNRPTHVPRGVLGGWGRSLAAVLLCLASPRRTAMDTPASTDDGNGASASEDARTWTPGALQTTAGGGPVSVNEAMLARGEHVGRYLILACIGQGGMGVVYAAHDPELDRKVALKLLRVGSSDATLSGELRISRSAVTTCGTSMHARRPGTARCAAVVASAGVTAPRRGVRAASSRFGCACSSGRGSGGASTTRRSAGGSSDTPGGSRRSSARPPGHCEARRPGPPAARVARRPRPSSARPP